MRRTPMIVAAVVSSIFGVVSVASCDRETCYDCDMPPSPHQEIRIVGHISDDSFKGLSVSYCRYDHGIQIPDRSLEVFDDNVSVNFHWWDGGISHASGVYLPSKATRPAGEGIEVVMFLAGSFYSSSGFIKAAKIVRLSDHGKEILTLGEIRHENLPRRGMEDCEPRPFVADVAG